MNPRKFLLGIGIAVSTLISSSLGANAARVDPETTGVAERVSNTTGCRRGSVVGSDCRKPHISD